MFSDAFTQLKAKETERILEKLNLIVDGKKFDPATTKISVHSPSFYNGYALYEVKENGSNARPSLSFLMKEEPSNNDMYILDGTNLPIYFLNKQVPVFLNKDNISEYVKFFFFYVQGRFGKFYIIENVDEIQWLEEPVTAGRNALARMIDPVTFEKEDEQGNFHVKVSIIFKSSLFESIVIINENGEVNLSNQEMLVEDIPVASIFE